MAKHRKYNQKRRRAKEAEEQQAAGTAVSNRPRTFHVYSTLIQFCYSIFFLLDPTPKKIGRPGYATEEERREATLAKYRRYNKKRRGGGEEREEECSATKKKIDNKKN